MGTGSEVRIVMQVFQVVMWNLNAIVINCFEFTAWFTVLDYDGLFWLYDDGSVDISLFQTQRRIPL